MACPFWRLGGVLNPAVDPDLRRAGNNAIGRSTGGSNDQQH